MYKFQSSTCKTVGEKLRTKLCPRTDGQTDGRTAMAIPVYTPPPRCESPSIYSESVPRSMSKASTYNYVEKCPKLVETSIDEAIRSADGSRFYT